MIVIYILNIQNVSKLDLKNMEIPCLSNYLIFSPKFLSKVTDLAIAVFNT